MGSREIGVEGCALLRAPILSPRFSFSLVAVPRIMRAQIHVISSDTAFTRAKKTTLTTGNWYFTFRHPYNERTLTFGNEGSSGNGTYQKYYSEYTHVAAQRNDFRNARLQRRGRAIVCKTWTDASTSPRLPSKPSEEGKRAVAYE